MDKRIDYKIVLDTETCPLDKDLQDVVPYNMLAYDVGWAICDKRGNVYKTRSFVIADVFLYFKELMKSAYYADKIPMYWDDIKQGKRKLAKLSTIRKIFLEDVAEYGSNKVFAHNMRFDYNVLNNTIRYITKSKIRYFFPYGMEICDTLKMARDVIVPKPTYRRFCEDNGYLAKNGRPRATAEILYRYISGDNDFIESHTGLEDTLIEKDIMAYCYRQHKKMRRLLYEN